MKQSEFLRDHGRAPGDVTFFNAEVAYKYKMTSMQAALGLAQIERVEELIARKREIFSWYENELRDVDGITLNYEAPETKNTYWMVTAIADDRFGLDKKDIIERMKARNIDCRPFFYPLSAIPAYRHCQEAWEARARNVVSYRTHRNGINLPSGLNLTHKMVNRVCSELLSAIK